MKVVLELTKTPTLNFGSADVLIRTTDPLVFRFEDDTEIETYALCDRTAVKRSCGFYELSEELLKALARKQVTNIRQFVTRLDSDRNPKIEATEDEREYVEWDRLSGPDWNRKVPDTAKCAL